VKLVVRLPRSRLARLSSVVKVDAVPLSAAPRRELLGSLRSPPRHPP